MQLKKGSSKKLTSKNIAKAVNNVKLRNSSWKILTLHL